MIPSGIHVGNTGEKTAEVLIAAMHSIIGGVLKEVLHFGDQCIDVSFGKGLWERCKSRAVASSRGRRNASTNETMGRPEATSFFLLGRM